MVDFETEVYYQEDTNMTGVRVLVASDVGDVIDTIQVTNKTDFDELMAILEDIDERYVKVADGSSLSGETLDTILTNLGTGNTINASHLGGQPNTYYAKATHTHTAEDVSGIYQYDISISNYNPNIGDEITVTAKVTDYNDTPVNNKLITIKKDNSNWANGVKTNSNGEYTKKFTATTAGVVNFGIKNAKAQVNVKDAWKQVPLAKTVPFNAQLWILESQNLANLQVDIPRYLGWCDNGDKNKIVRPEINSSPETVPYIGENGFTGRNYAGKSCTDYVDNNGSLTYTFLGTDTHAIIPTQYCPQNTLSQTLWKGYWNVYLEADGSFCGSAYQPTSNMSNGVKENWSVSVKFNNVWRY